MCGIIVVIGEQDSKTKHEVLKRIRRLRHRGPDWSGMYDNSNNVIVAHERLAIVDPANGAQPLYSKNKKQILGVNGEIYNHLELPTNETHLTKSDCECILHLYNQCFDVKLNHSKSNDSKTKAEPHDAIRGFLNRLNGIFAFVLIDEERGYYLIARDHMGIVPLYFGCDAKNRLWVSSELKGLCDICKQFKEFPIGGYVFGKLDFSVPQTEVVKKWYTPKWHDESYVPSSLVPLSITDTKSTTMDKKSSQPNVESVIPTLRSKLQSAVIQQLMSDVPFGVLLSGGLDSSIITSIVAKHFQTNKNKEKLHSFSVGLPGAPDLEYAKVVAEHLGTEHHELLFTIEEGLRSLNDVIYHLETYDITTIRAATPMYLLSRKIKSMGIKMVLSGEGSDEMFGGYAYFHKAPNALEFHKETVRKLKALSQYDCLRANKATMAWGLEARVPFLEKDFLDYVMSLDPADKMCGSFSVPKKRIEKWLLRKAFETDLPQSIIGRSKVQFSDGCGYGWIDSLKEYSSKQVSDADMKSAPDVFPVNTPLTKEAYLYRSIFETHYPEKSAIEGVPGGPSIACSSATAFLWDEAFQKCNDPSGRSVVDAVQMYQK